MQWLTRSDSSAPLVRRTAVVIIATVLAMVGTLWTVLMVRGDRPLDGPAGDGGWTSRSRAWFTARGLYPHEQAPDTGRNFTWTRTGGTFTIPVLDRSRPHTLRLTLRGLPQAAGRPAQTLMLVVDGAAAGQHVLTGREETVDIALPPFRASSATVRFTLSHGMVPGPDDPRELGMIIYGVALEGVKASPLRIPVRALTTALAAAACLGLAMALISGSLPAALLLGCVVAVGQGWLLGLDGAFLGNAFAWRLVRLNGGILVGAALWRAITQSPRVGLHPEWHLATAIVIAVFALRLAVFLHPAVTVGDSIFHVHRAEVVQGGQYYFTSVTPRPFFEFPYAPGLYVAASPLWKTFRTQWDQVLLLRSIVLTVDAVAALTLFGMLRRHWNGNAALVAAGIFQLVPVGLHTVCTSNLTNGFAQSVMTIALCLWLWLWRPGRAALILGGVALTTLLTIAFLSHLSTFSTGIPIVIAMAIALAWSTSRQAALLAIVALAAALLLSYLVYYSHFHDVYQKTFERILAGEGHAATRSMVAPVSTKIARFGQAVRHEYYGLPLAFGALVGACVLARRYAGDVLSRPLLAWLFVIFAFFALGVFTPIEMRAALASQPVAVACFGLMASWMWAHGPAPRALAVALTCAVAVRGVTDWLLCLGLYQPS